MRNWERRKADGPWEWHEGKRVYATLAWSDEASAYRWQAGKESGQHKRFDVARRQAEAAAK